VDNASINGKYLTEVLVAWYKKTASESNECGDDQPGDIWRTRSRVHHHRTLAHIYFVRINKSPI